MVLANIIAGETTLLLGEIVEVELLETIGLEIGNDLGVNLVALLDERPHGSEDGFELLARRHVGLILANIGRDDGKVHETAPTRT